MPIRVKSKRLPSADRGASPVSVRYDYELPKIGPDDTFREVVKKLSEYECPIARV